MTQPQEPKPEWTHDRQFNVILHNGKVAKAEEVLAALNRANDVDRELLMRAHAILSRILLASKHPHSWYGDATTIYGAIDAALREPADTQRKEDQ